MPTPPASPSPRSAGSLLAGLNDAQRGAAGFGVDRTPCAAIGPLLIVAGAGSGKTLTLAARVARLILAGADPARLLLLTFSRRAALEMERRVGRVLHDSLGLSSLQPPPRLPWCGTFHSVGARLLRSIAAQVGLDPSFTVDDRADSEDLMHVLRQRLGLANGARRFPQKGTCLAIYSRAVNARKSIGEAVAETFPWCLGHEPELGRLFTAYAE
jgi:DNA helicase-2/ATP-dependent DNA helicase PcrA